MNEKRDRVRLQQFGVKYRALRDQLNLSQDEVAARCDIAKSIISMIENGKKDFTFTTFLELARGLGKHPKKLLDEDFDFLKDW